MGLKNVRRLVLVATAALFVTAVGRAGVFDMEEGLVSLEFVPVGNAGNSPDANCYGAVAYDFEIGKYEVTAGQYTVFLNAVAKTAPRGLYNRHMVSNEFGCKIRQINVNVEQGKSPKVPGAAKVPPSYTYSVSVESANRPVNFVSFWAAARFANWLHNGQGNGDTETGAYTLKGYKEADGREIARNPGAKYWIPSENEWYKACYHKNDGKTGNYFSYPTGSDTAPTAQLPPGTDLVHGSANCRNASETDVKLRTTLVGAYNAKDVKGRFVSASPYGTFDQGGNVWEWTDTAVYQSQRGLRGGSFSSYEGADALHSDSGNMAVPTTCSIGYGFRVARAPEKR